MTFSRILGRGRGRVLLVLGAVCAVAVAGHLASCGCGGPDDSARGPAQFTAHQFLKGGKPARQIGEECSQYGGSQCLTGLCLHHKPDPHSGWVCSKGCLHDGECPSAQGWSCRSILPPVPGNQYCVPPDSWTPKVAIAASPVSKGPPAKDGGHGGPPTGQGKGGGKP